MTSTSTSTLTSKIYDSLPSIGAIILIFLCAANFFIKGGVPISGTISLWLGWTLPFATGVGAIFLCMTHIRHIMRRESGWYYKSLVMLITFFGVLIASLALPKGQSDLNLTLFYQFFGQGVSAGVIIMCSISIVMGYLRVYVARTTMRLVMLAIAIFCIAATTGVFHLTGFYPLIQSNVLIQGYLIGQVEYVAWAVYHIGNIALITRILLLQERLRP